MSAFVNSILSTFGFLLTFRVKSEFHSTCTLFFYTGFTSRTLCSSCKFGARTIQQHVICQSKWRESCSSVTAKTMRKETAVSFLAFLPLQSFAIRTWFLYHTTVHIPNEVLSFHYSSTKKNIKFHVMGYVNNVVVIVYDPTVMESS